MNLFNVATSLPCPTSVHRCLYSCSVVPDNAQYLREDLEGAIRLAASPPLSDIIETIWVVGGTGVYKVHSHYQHVAVHCNVTPLKECKKVHKAERSVAPLLTGLCFCFLFHQESLMHPWCDLIYLTDVMANIDCDVFFPNFDRQIFKKQDRYDL